MGFVYESFLTLGLVVVAVGQGYMIGELWQRYSKLKTEAEEAFDYMAGQVGVLLVRVNTLESAIFLDDEEGEHDDLDEDWETVGDAVVPKFQVYDWGTLNLDLNEANKHVN